MREEKTIRFAPLLQDPRDGSALSRMENDQLLFQSGNCYPTCGGVPILLDEARSIFRANEVLKRRATTQSPGYSTRSSLKNRVRRNLLPELSVGAPSQVRWAQLKNSVANDRVLILGAGEKSRFYQDYFGNAEVITSDVHLQFDVDVVLDAHQIPFKDETFSLVLAAQVLEHTARPWEVAAEAQRVTKLGGYIQMEVPFAFPFHAAPYDFYRFTPSALRFLFSRSLMVRLEVVGGGWGAAATATSAALVDSFKQRQCRMAALACSRLCLWWMKYLDRFGRNKLCTMPKGLAVTFRRDDKQRSDRDMLDELA